MSSADAIAAIQHARMLANLRGRPQVVLDDVRDAILTCCCKGDPEDAGEPLLRAIALADTGTRVGRPTDAVGRLPIVSDFYDQVDAADLGDSLKDDLAHERKLDLREPMDATRSALLHRLAFLDVPFGTAKVTRRSGLASATLFKEVWTVRFRPDVEAELTEKSSLGETIELAAMHHLRSALARNPDDAAAVSGRLLDALDMDLPGLLAVVHGACSAAIDADPKFASLATALGHLLVLDRITDARGRTGTDVEELIQRCFARACFAIPQVASAPREAEREIATGLRGMAEAVLSGREPPLDRELFVSSVRDAAARSTVPFLAGVFRGLLAEIRAVPATELADAITAYAHAPVDAMIQAGDFLAGALAVSRTSIMLGADELIAAVDTLAQRAPEDAFLTMLPRLRAAFHELSGPQLAQLSQRVAVRYGLAHAEELDLDTSVEAGAVISRLDATVAAILAEWHLA